MIGIVFDIDDVLRGLNPAVMHNHPEVRRNQSDWHDFPLDLVTEKMIEDMEKTEYFPVFMWYVEQCRKNNQPILIFTAQIKEWRISTLRWLEDVLGDLEVEVLFSTSSETKEEIFNIFREKGYYIVEDCPCWKNYKNVILVDKEYNRGVRGAIRVYTPEALEVVINAILSGVTVKPGDIVLSGQGKLKQ